MTSEYMEQDDLINELKLENQRLHKQIAKLEVKSMPSQHRIDALESELKTKRVSPEDAKLKLFQLLGLSIDEIDEKE